MENVTNDLYNFLIQNPGSSLNIISTFFTYLSKGEIEILLCSDDRFFYNNGLWFSRI